MNGDRAINPIPACDFNRTAELSCSDALVVAATEYGMLATPEQIDRMMLAAYGPDRIPGTESRRRSQEGRPQEGRPTRTCSIPGCGKKHMSRGWCGMHYMRWYSHGDPLWTRPPKPIPTPGEIQAEMREALARLVEVVEK